jgi:hypothetical protein
LGYTADSFAAGEQPTAAKWNELFANDVSFNNGTGIGTNAIAAASLATNAIKLANITDTSSPTLTSGGGLVTVCTTGVITIPAGGRDIEIIGFIPQVACGGTATGTIGLYDGSTELQLSNEKWVDLTYTKGLFVYVTIPAVAAGSKTYNLKAAGTGGANLQVNNTATRPSVLTVKAI